MVWFFTNFHDNGIARKILDYACLSVVTIDSIMKMDRKYYCQVYLEERKYIVKENKMKNFIDVELKLDHSDNSDSG